MMASSFSAGAIVEGFLAFTLSTLTPLVSMGVMTMKMISRTSMTSTMGVTLMSAIVLPLAFLFDIAIDNSFAPHRHGPCAGRARHNSAFRSLLAHNRPLLRALDE